MKTAWFIRHAKSSWDFSLDDMVRPLNERGYRDAAEMAKRVKKLVTPDLIVSSPAVRAYSTALIFCRQYGFDPSSIELQPALYDSSATNYLYVLAALPAEKNEVFIFGHNPVITETVNCLAGTELADIPTCGIVGIQFDVPTWKESAAAAGKMVHYDFPKNKSGS